MDSTLLQVDAQAPYVPTVGNDRLVRVVLADLQMPKKLVDLLVHWNNPLVQAFIPSCSHPLY